MTSTPEPWLQQLQTANTAFRRGLDTDRLPVDRSPGRYGLITCMDPRINLSALGIPPFAADGSCTSGVRIIRTIGAMAEDRSLIVGIHLAGIREFAVVMHTDCGNCLAKAKIEDVRANLQATLSECGPDAVGDPLAGLEPADLATYLKVFDDPYEAVAQEVAAIRAKAFVPRDVVLHGLVYDLATAELSLVVDGDR